MLFTSTPLPQTTLFFSATSWRIVGQHPTLIGLHCVEIGPPINDHII